MNGRTELPTASPAHTPAGERYSPRKNEPSEGTPEQQPAQLHQPKRVPRMAASSQWPNPIPQVPGPAGIRRMPGRQLPQSSSCAMACLSRWPATRPSRQSKTHPVRVAPSRAAVLRDLITDLPAARGGLAGGTNGSGFGGGPLAGPVARCGATAGRACPAGTCRRPATGGRTGR